MADFEDHVWRDLFDEADLRIYRRYARETKVGANPALLAIDLFNKVYQGGPGRVAERDAENPGACGDFAWDAIEPTQRLLAAARAAGLPVIYTTSPPRSAGGLRATRRGDAAGAGNLDPFAIKDDLAPAPGEAVILKERASAFFGTPLQARLQMLGIDSLIVCGETTSGCVRASVVDGYSCGFHVTVVEECVFDRSLLCHKVNLFDMHHKYADVMGLDQVVEALKSTGRSE